MYNVRYLCVSDGNMEDQELVEQQSKEAFLQGENVMMHLHTFAAASDHQQPQVLYVTWNTLVGRNICSLAPCARHS